MLNQTFSEFEVIVGNDYPDRPRPIANIIHSHATVRHLPSIADLLTPLETKPPVDTHQAHRAENT